MNQKLSPFTFPVIFVVLCSVLLINGQVIGITNSGLNIANIEKSKGSISLLLPLSTNSEYPLSFNKTDQSELYFKHEDSEFEWGLALSGGGIRSASFSIGVLKALYDKDIEGERLLNQIDIISSVSGGGYASLWAISHYLSGSTPSDTKFGEKIFDDGLFVRNICRLQSESNFVTKKTIFTTLFGSNKKAFETYEDKILNTFGNSWKQNTKENKLNALLAYVESEKMPYFIFNTTLERGELGKLGQVVEITPEYIGNPVLGYYKWKQDSEMEVLRISEAVTISAAGVRVKLKRKLHNFSKEVIRRKKLTLYDGGYSENLGALPLIRRGVKNVIISDAEHDPGYKFGGYLELQKILRDVGINFCVEGLESCDNTTCKPLNNSKNKIKFSNSAVNIGCAKSDPKVYKGTPKESKVYYVKMAKPDSIYLAGKFNKNRFAERTRENVLESGENLIIKRQGLIKIAGTENEVDCEKAIEIKFNPDMYFFRANSYNTYLSNRKLFRFTGAVFPKSFQYKFPQISTFDQNYYADQLEAFVALGYLEASELKFENN